MRLILYSKPGCHLCEGLQEKLQQIENLDFELEVRDITTRDDWFEAFQYEIPLLFKVSSPNDATEQPIPRPSPRATVQHLKEMLKKYLT
jgi:pyrimidine operon attenuation protein/uracil phosphoribosyltransferase